RQFVKGMRPTPIEPDFTLEYFFALVTGLAAGDKRSVKALLTQEGLIPGLGNAIAQDIMFRAGLHPKHPIAGLEETQLRALHNAIRTVVDEVIAGGGRYDEVDLFNRPGGYRRLMDSSAVGRPCPICGMTVEKFPYLGGACYVCPHCQE
ncbi:MAG TPA: endonuclease VIII, partial [Anaerolineae bacterium]